MWFTGTRGINSKHKTMLYKLTPPTSTASSPARFVTEIKSMSVCLYFSKKFKKTLERSGSLLYFFEITFCHVAKKFTGWFFFSFSKPLF